MRVFFRLNEVRQGLRELGVGLVIAGLVGVLVGGDSVATFEGLALLVVGLVLWVLGLVRTGSKGGSHET